MAPPKGVIYNVKGEGGKPKIQDEKFIEKEAEALFEWIKNPGNLFLKRFAIERGYSPQRLTEFAAKSNKFAEALERARATQEIRLVEGGLGNAFNAGFTKFVLINCHSQEWSERSETKLSGDAMNPLAFLLQKVDGQSKDLVDET